MTVLLRHSVWLLCIFGTTGYGEGFVHCIVRVSWEVWPHATLVIVVERIEVGGHGLDER